MSDVTRIAAVRIFGGETEPFYDAKLRLFYRDVGTGKQQVVSDVAGLRVLLAEGDARVIKTDNGRFSVHPPLLLRAAVRPQRDKGKGENHGVELRLHSNDRFVTGDLQPTVACNDVLLTPIGGWPSETGPYIDVPPMRLTAGQVPVKLQANGSDLATFLRYTLKGGQSTLFGGFRLKAVTKKLIDLTLVPQGIEFDGSLPDPTRDLKEGSATEARIEGRFRLEGAHSDKTKISQYWLRLVSGDPAAMNELEGRIAAAFARVSAEKNSPLAVRFDRRPAVPPLLWPLHISGSGLSLRLAIPGAPISALPGEFLMAIDPTAVDARFRTVSSFPGDMPGVAAIQGEQLQWVKHKTGFAVLVSAGMQSQSDERVKIAFKRDGQNGWTTELSEFGVSKVNVPLEATRERLLETYKRGRSVPADSVHAPYAFFPLINGWLQLKLEGGARREQLATVTEANTMTGRIVASRGDATAMRAVVLDGAGGVSFRMRWERSSGGALEPSGAELTVVRPIGRIRGFLFVADVSPTAAEALPDLRAGPAATRDVPLEFNMPSVGLALRGSFRSSDTDWLLNVEELLDVQPGGDASFDPPERNALRGSGVPGGYAWLNPYGRPFITNFPLTRSASNPLEPSATRSLLRHDIESRMSLSGKAGSAAPVLTLSDPLAIALGPPSNPYTGHLDQTLILTTLPGTEFVPMDWPKQQGRFRAALRHDLSILDELFAWSEPPPPKDQAKDPDREEKPAASAFVVTALDPDALAEVWDLNKRRMKLTRTQDVYMTPWVECGSASHGLAVTTLVQPYSWDGGPFGIDLAPTWGKYTLAGKGYELNAALEGLDVDLRVDGGGKLVPGTSIAVRGNAASLFKRDASGYLWDSRGTGLEPHARSGARAIGYGGQPAGEWRTLERAIEITCSTPEFPWMEGAKIGFFTRDLLVVSNVFDGSKNPIEAEFGSNGKAFERAHLRKSLHEWRMFEWRAEPAKARELGPKPFDIELGPFLFQPLRLKQVQFDTDRHPKLIEVIGGLRIGDRPNDDTSQVLDGGPFAADKAYMRSDLFCLSLKRKDKTWAVSWAGVKLSESVSSKEDDLVELEFADRDPTLTSRVTLSVDCENGVKSAENAEVHAVIELNLVSGAAKLGARLFGKNCRLPATAKIDKGISLDFQVDSAADAQSAVLFRLDSMKVSLKSRSRSILINGCLLVQPKPTQTPEPLGKPDEMSSLASFGRLPADCRWLDLALGAEGEPSLAVDHLTGRISASWSGVWTGARPLFGFLEPGEFDVRSRIEALVSGADSSSTTEKLSTLAATTAWMRVSGHCKSSSNRIDHRLLLGGTAPSNHAIDVSWDAEYRSPVLWPVGPLLRTDGSEVPEEWLVPGNADSTAAGRARDIRIPADVILVHDVVCKLRKHRIEAELFSRVGGRVTALDRITLLAQVDHEVARKLKDGEDPTTMARRVAWTTVDYVTITSLHNMVELAKARAFVARYPLQQYRGKAQEPFTPYPGIAHMHWAVSGFFDEALIRHYESDALRDVQHEPVLLGGAALVLTLLAPPKREAAGRLEGGPEASADALVPVAVSSVMPWAGLSSLAKSYFGELTQAGGAWKVSSVDLWAGSSISQETVPRATSIAAALDAPALLDVVGRGLATPDLGEAIDGAVDAGVYAGVLPVEQAFFENLRRGSNGAIDLKSDRESAPFFLRSLIAIASCWRASAGKSDTSRLERWRALSIIPSRGASAGRYANPVLAVEVKQASRVIARPPRSPSQHDLVLADLVVLSTVRAERDPGYRLLHGANADDLGDGGSRAELIERARDVLLDAECVVREADVDTGLPFLVVAGMPRRRQQADSAGMLAVDHPSLAPSAALGWPSSEALEGLYKLAPVLGHERPVQSQAAGFAARFRQLGLPGHTRTRTAYLAFSHRVAFLRNTKEQFRGPPARHLSPVNTRLRVPLEAVQEVPVQVAAHVGLETGADAPPPRARLRSVIPPFFELATIGRRPGVFEVVTAGVTVAAEPIALDPKHDRFGQPAASGPVVAHQLRTPRSPALPDDAADRAAVDNKTEDVLKVRRRTYVSLADGSAKEKLARLLVGSASEDVLRYSNGDCHLRVAMSLGDGRTAETPLIGPDWNGQQRIAIAGVAVGFADAEAAVVACLDERSARLEIGARAFELSGSPLGGTWPNLTWDLKATEDQRASQLQEIREELRRSATDTPIRLVVTVQPEPGGAVPAKDALALAPRQQLCLPLALDPGDRAVMPTRMRTVTFGDPSYDRQLGSEAASDVNQFNEHRVLLAIDRSEYDPAATLYLAVGAIDMGNGLFDPAEPVVSLPVTIGFRRLPKPKPDGTPVAPEDLTLAGHGVVTAFSATPGKPHEVPLRMLRSVGGGSSDPSPLEPGDRLEILAAVGTPPSVSLLVRAGIVATPVIAPAPSVFSVLHVVGSTSRVVLHAAAPLPQHVELPGLAEGLARGYVARRALFVWRYVQLGPEEATAKVELVKYDRSGGAQLPNP